MPKSETVKTPEVLKEVKVAITEIRQEIKQIIVSTQSLRSNVYKQHGIDCMETHLPQTEEQILADLDLKKLNKSLKLCYLYIDLLEIGEIKTDSLEGVKKLMEKALD